MVSARIKLYDYIGYKFETPMHHQVKMQDLLHLPGLAPVVACCLQGLLHCIILSECMHCQTRKMLLACCYDQGRIAVYSDT